LKVSFIHVLVYFLQSLFLHTFFIFKTSLNSWYNLVIALHISMKYIERLSCSYAYNQTKESWMQDKHDHYLLHLSQVSSTYLYARMIWAQLKNWYQMTSNLFMLQWDVKRSWNLTWKKRTIENCCRWKYNH